MVNSLLAVSSGYSLLRDVFWWYLASPESVNSIHRRYHL